ncbi:ABC transporter ATP-binding protein [Candidatus Sumerlaeota bacterium]|nr:ABC transporter ATP-binding protein [Candidatus Sumerlaeota bacterium]
MTDVDRTNTPVLRLKDVYYTYPDGVESLRGVSLEVYRDEKVGLVGPNGAGKSTLMTVVIGIRIPRTGEVEVLGQVLNPKTRREIRRRAGLVFQDPDDQLFCPTVFDEVAFAPINMGYPEEQVTEMVARALKQVDLEGYERRSSFHLSIGERKRLAFATVLSYSPEILLIDEPSANLDPQHRRQTINLLKSLPQTMLIATHDLDLVLDVCERCFVINRGRIVADGDVESILTDEQLLLSNGLELPLSRQ